MPATSEAVRALSDYRVRWAKWLIVDIVEWFNRSTPGVLFPQGPDTGWVNCKVDPGKARVV